jgi:Na+/phosphate symporter
MFAILAAVVFGVGLILDWANVKQTDFFSTSTFLFLGLLFISLHLVGLWPWRGRNP